MMVWWIAGAMAALALAFVLPALLRRHVDAPTDPTALNVELHRERLRELEAEHAAGELDRERLAQARAELELRLLRDAAVSTTPSGAPSRRSGIVALLLALLLPAAVVGLYRHYGMPALWQQTGADAASAQVQQVEQLLSRLAERLRAEPANGEGWLMLARSHVLLEHYPEAIAAYARALLLGEERPDVLADYAEVLALSQNEQLAGAPEALLVRALVLDPAHPRSLWLAGLARFEAEDFAAAIAHWQALQELAGNDAQSAELLAQYLAEAQSRLQQPAAATTGTAADAAAMDKAVFAALPVEVALAPDLAASAPADATVFVYARAAQGPRMPLAIVRRQVKDLPFSVQLDDSQGMLPELKLSQFDAVTVLARVSPTGQATPVSGELTGQSGPIQLPARQPVQVVIDTRIP